MKKLIIPLFLSLLVSSHAEAKTCKAILNGKIKKEAIPMVDPHVFYPNDSIHSRLAKWQGELMSKAYVNPPAIDIECGKPWLYGSFEPFKATGHLPQIIQTYPWTTIGPDGKPRLVESELLYGWGDSSDYPYPAVTFESVTDILINEPAPPGVKDICDIQKLDLPGPMSFLTFLKPDIYMPQYVLTTGEGQYRWDSTKAPADMPVTMELHDPSVTIMCENTWTYELIMEWPYSVEADHPSLCGPGSVNRMMVVKGTFITTEDNQVKGFIEVPVPTVSFSGSIWGNYTGSGFSNIVNGVLYNDDSGKSWVDIEMFEGGDGIAWNYAVTCPYGVLRNSLFAAVANYFQIYNFAENESPDNPFHFRFDAAGDERTFDVDMGGQGTVTFTRRWRRSE